MKAFAQGDMTVQEIDCELFSIEGSNDEFGVHRALPCDLAAGKPAFSASHLACGFLIGRGNTPEAAIADGRRQWASKTPEQRHTAISRAMGLRKMMAGETGGAA